MLKRLELRRHRVGRVRGDWWKWKVEPFAVDAVLINAQRGQRQAERAVHGLHVRRVGRRQAGTVREGVQRPDATRRSARWTPSSGRTRWRSSARSAR